MNILFEKRTVIRFCFFLTAALLCRSLSAQTVSNKPNIIIIMADDLDSRQLSCYGGQNLKTKHIDELAKNGLKFNQIIASEVMCVPTRASLFTGLYPVRHGAFQNHKPVYDNLKSVGHYLNDLGYKVGLTGKDHVTKPKSVFPFDIVPGFEPNCVSATDEYQLEDIKKYITQNDKPYCLFIMSINPHMPWTVGDTTEFNAASVKLPKDYVDTKLTRSEYVKYLAEIRRLDDQVGDITKLLKSTGQDKNTIFIFLGEQGAQFPGAKWNLWDAGQKSSMIVKWPGVVKPATETNALVQYEDITPTLIDIASGLHGHGLNGKDLKASGLNVNGLNGNSQENRNLDGKSFLPVILGNTNTARKYAYGIHNNIPEGEPYPIRSIRDEHYKLILNLKSDQEYYNRFMMNRERKDRNLTWFSWIDEAQKNAEAKKITDRFVKRPPIELYDLKKDPSEFNNLANDPAYRKSIAFYTQKLQAWMKQQGDKGAEIDIVYAKKPVTSNVPQ